MVDRRLEHLLILFHVKNLKLLYAIYKNYNEQQERTNGAAPRFDLLAASINAHSEVLTKVVYPLAASLTS